MEMLADLLKTITIAVKQGQNGGEKVDDPDKVEALQHYSQAPPRPHFHSNGGRNDDDDNAWDEYQARSHHPSYLQRIQTTKDMEAALRLTKKFVAPAPVQPIFTDENVDTTEQGGQHKPHSMVLDEPCISPTGSDAGQVQVRYQPPHSLPPTSPSPTGLFQPLEKTLRSGNKYPVRSTTSINKQATLLKKKNDKLSKEYFSSGSTSA